MLGTVLSCSQISSLIIERVQTWFVDRPSDESDRSPQQASRDYDDRQYHPSKRKSFNRTSSYDDDEEEEEDGHGHVKQRHRDGNTSGRHHDHDLTQSQPSRKVKLVTSNNTRSSTTTTRADTRSSSPSSGKKSAEILSASTTVSIAIPDSLIGNIMGRKVSNTDSTN